MKTRPLFLHRAFVALALAGLLGIAPARAVLPDEQLANPALEARALQISRELRCVVCPNQSIDDSNAVLARDLRILVRERLVAGDTDAQVKDFVAERYGTFVLMNPPFMRETILLWFGPLLVLMFGGIAAGLYMRGRSAVPEPPPLTDKEQKELRRLLETGDRA